MKLNVYYALLGTLCSLTLYAIPNSKLAKTSAKTLPKAQPKINSADANENIAYLSNLENLKLPISEKSALITSWQALYQTCKARNGTPEETTLTSQQTTAMAPLFQTNHFAMLEKQLNLATLAKLAPTLQNSIEKNYATFHLNKAVARLNSICNVEYNNGAPTVEFNGDHRDLGIIVNIQNNTESDFSVIQSSTDGKVATQIGHLKPGINGINLHTAALQEPFNQKNKMAPSAYSFDFYQLNTQNPTFISVRLYTGAQLVTFLKSLPRKNQKTIEMNGLATSPEYVANPKDWYMVLIQNPTPSTSTTRNPDQRIQAINVSKLSGPYLLTMQINQETIHLNPDTPSTTPQTINVIQPSISQVRIMQNKQIKSFNIPLLILPKFLWDIDEIQTSWTLLTTTLLAALTNFKLFQTNSFGNAFEYFKHLSCFTNNHNHAFFIDLYNIINTGSLLYNAPWLIANAIYETNLSCCSDIPQIYTAQDAYGNIVVNAHEFYYINFLAVFTPQVTQIDNQALFIKEGFNSTFAFPLSQLYSFIINALVADIKEGIFADLTKIKHGIYKLTWTNKKNKVLNSQYLYLDHPLSNIEISFVNNTQTSTWVGSSVPTQLIQLQPQQTSHFKVTYEYSSTNNKHILLAQTTSPIDKQEVFLPLYFTQYPIENFSIDVFNSFNIMPYTHCEVIKNGNLPEPLIGLTAEDWQSGIYIVPLVHNNDQITFSKPGVLTLIFYKADKTLLGKINIQGFFNNNTMELGIKEPVHAYNAYLTKPNSLIDLYLSTGLFLQYIQPS